MKQKRQNRLAILREQLGWTRRELARRAGLSTVYIKKLETGERPMTRRPAIAIADVTAVDIGWLRGQFRPYPILAAFTAPCVSGTEKRYQVQLGRGVMPNLMRPWSPEMAKKLRERRVDARAANQDAVLCLTHFLLNCHFLANIILTGYRAMKPTLAIARISSAIGTLHEEFKAPGLQLPPRYFNKDVGRFDPTGADAVAGDIANRLVHDLKAAIKKRPTVT
jgi:transcriptional regulator with XRE-family HTH domain